MNSAFSSSIYKKGDKVFVFLCCACFTLHNGFYHLKQIPMTTAALFKIAKAHKQPNCPLVVDWTKKMGYVHNVILSSEKQTEGNPAMCDGDKTHRALCNVK